MACTNSTIRCDGSLSEPYSKTIHYLTIVNINIPCAHNPDTPWKPYTADLLALDYCRPIQEYDCPQLSQIQTPLIIPSWQHALDTHPDRAFARYIINGLTHGFRIGFRHGAPLHSATRNMPSAIAHPEVVTTYLEKEQSLGRLLVWVDYWAHTSPATRHRRQSK